MNSIEQLNDEPVELKINYEPHQRIIFNSLKTARYKFHSEISCQDDFFSLLPISTPLKEGGKNLGQIAMILRDQSWAEIKVRKDIIQKPGMEGWFARCSAIEPFDYRLAAPLTITMAGEQLIIFDGCHRGMVLAKWLIEGKISWQPIKILLGLPTIKLVL